MTGANYMGGKRNAIRSRGKDKDASTQRNFFGKQRLQILSKGFLSSATQDTDEMQNGTSYTRKGAGMADISLAHARQKIPLQGKLATTTSSWIPKPVDTSMFSVPERIYERFGAHTSTPKTKTRARILQKLDGSEPYALKQLLERVRQTPDLAGLSRATKTEFSTRTPLHKDRVGKGQQEGTTSDDSSILPSQSSRPSIVLAAESDAGLNLDPVSPAFSRYANGSSERQISEYQGRWSHRAMSSFSSMEIPASSSCVYEGDRCFDTPDGEVEADGSSSRPSQSRSSPPTSPEDEFDRPRFHWSPGQLNRYTMGVEGSNQEGMGNDAANLPDSRMSSSNSDYSPEFRSNFDERGLPTVIRLPGPSEEYSPSSIYGSLFLHPDPWNLIGDILDRGEQAFKYDGMESTSHVSGDANMDGSENEWRTTSFMGMRSSGESAEDAEWLAAERMFGLDLDPFNALDRVEEGGKCEGMECCEEEFSDVEMDAGAHSPFTKRGSPTTTRHSSQASQEYLPEPSDIQPTGALLTAHATPEFDQLHGSDVRTGDHDNNCDGIVGLPQSPPEMETNAVRLEPAEIESLLAMPQLREVDGRYVGPSLFSNEPDDDDGW